MDTNETRPLLPERDGDNDSLQSVARAPTLWNLRPHASPPPPYYSLPTSSDGGSGNCQTEHGVNSVLNSTASDNTTPLSNQPEGASQGRPVPPGFPVMMARLLSAAVLVLYMAANIGSIPLQAQYVYTRLQPQYLNMSDNSYVDAGACTANYSDPRVIALGELQAAVADVLLYFSLSNTGPMVLTTILLGAYSDIIGRKLLFLLPTVAGLGEFVVTAIIVRFELSLDYFYVIQVVEGFSGSFSTLLLATFSYTADLTPPAKARTFAITILECCLALAGAGASIGVGYLILYVSYFYAAILLAICMALAVAIVIFAMPETIQRQHQHQHQHVNNQPTRQLICHQPPSRNPLKYVKNIFSFYFTGSPRRRFQFLLALTVLFLILLCFLGRNGVETLYQLNAPFCFNSAEIGVYGAVSVGVRAVGSLGAVRLLQNFLSDPAIAAVTLLSGVAANVIEGLAGNMLVLYLSTVAGIISNAALPVTRAILSKMAGASKQGALFASVAVLESLCSLASNSMYNAIYEATVVHMRGAAFFCTAGVIVLCLLLVLVFMRVTSGGSLLPEEDLAPHVQNTTHVKPTRGLPSPPAAAT